MERISAGGVVVSPEGKLVVVEQGGNSWSLPKGGIEAGEEAQEAARREIREETGITDLHFLCELGAYYRRGLDMRGKGEDATLPETKRIFFLFQTSQTAVHGDGREITDARFVTIDEAVCILTHPKDKEFLESVRSTIAQYVS